MSLRGDNALSCEIKGRFSVMIEQEMTHNNGAIASDTQ